MSIIDKQNVAYPQMEYYLATKKESNTDTCYSVDGPLEYCAKWKKPDIKNNILYDSVYMKHPEQTNPKRRK